jgi:hypothetical protein
MVTQPERSELEELARMTEADLLRRIGHETRPRGFYADNRSDEEKERAGRTWLQRFRPELEKFVCGGTTATELDSKAGTSLNEKIVAVCAVADCIASAVINVSPFTAAALLVHLGVKSFCEGRA